MRQDKITKQAIAVAMTLALEIGLIVSPLTALAQTVPKKYQGDWVELRGGHINVTASAIDFGSGFKGNITSIKPGTESGEVLLVKYSSRPVSQVELVWQLFKINGRDTLIAVNAEEPTSIFVYQRPH